MVGQEQLRLTPSLGGDNPFSRARLLRIAAILAAVSVALVIAYGVAGLFGRSSLGAAVDVNSPATARIHAQLRARTLAVDASSSAPRVTRRITAAPRLSVVQYTIQSGGTLKDVSRIFGIPLADLQALNPTVSPEEFIDAGQRVVTYRAGVAEKVPESEVRSDRLYDGVPLPDGPGRRIRRRRTSWGTSHTIANLDRALRVYGAAYPQGPVVIVSDLSVRQGGRLPPHHTHRAGRDVDLSYIPRPELDNGGFILMDERTFDPERNWTFINAMLETGEVDVILMDRRLQKILRSHASSLGLSEVELDRIFQYPRNTRDEVGIIRHWEGHRDHMHVRFSCPPERTCQ